MSIEYVAVETTSGNIEAEILKGLLEAQGVTVMLSQEAAASALGLGAGVGKIGQVDILVPKDEESNARQVLKDYYEGKFEEDA